MTDKERSEQFTRFSLQYEALLSALVQKKYVDPEFVPDIRKQFYKELNEEKLSADSYIKTFRESIHEYMRVLQYEDMVSLSEMAKQYTEDSPGYVIQSWMRSRNTLEFLRQWELEENLWFDKDACDTLIQQAKATALTMTPSLWIRKTKAIGMVVKQGKGGGVKAHLEIAADFQMWLDPTMRLSVVRYMREGRQ